MRAPSTGELLDVWEAGRDRDHTDRALLLLAHASTGSVERDLADLSVGARDRLLLDLRERLFGPRVEAVDRCPECGAQLAITFDVVDIRLDPAESAVDRLRLAADGYEIAVRLPTSRDLVSVRACRTVAEARARIISRCLVAVREAGMDTEPDDLPEAIWQEIARALGEADPQADVELALECAACGHTWRTHFDIVDFLWHEVEQFGRRTVRDVHLLARSYGWSEDAILALSPRRRRLYLELVVDG